MTPSAEAQIRFLQSVERVLEEGLFTASYKYALLLSLADLAVGAHCAMRGTGSLRI